MPTDLRTKVFRYDKTTLDELKYYKQEFNINPSGLVRKILEVGCQNLEEKVKNKAVSVDNKKSAARKYYAVRLQKKYLQLIKDVADKYGIPHIGLLRGILNDGLEKFRRKIHQRQNEIPTPAMGKGKPSRFQSNRSF